MVTSHVVHVWDLGMLCPTLQWVALEGAPIRRHKRALAALAAGHVPEPGMSSHEIEEWLDALGFSSSVATTVDRDAQAQLRARDRLAQRDPEEAIRSYRAEYERGVRLADLLRQVLSYLRQRSDAGEVIVVHGRDGELIHQLCRRAGIRTRYVISSRSLTTQADGRKKEYDSYLHSRVPDGAIHVDTGFAGSVPRWFAGHGWVVREIQLVSAQQPHYQIPIEGFDDTQLRDIVLADLEHSAQRLETPRSWPPRYSHEAMGFWARLYGACDALGLPRQIRGAA